MSGPVFSLYLEPLLNFPKIHQDRETFAEGLRIILGMYNPGLPSTYRLIHCHQEYKKHNGKL